MSKNKLYIGIIIFGVLLTCFSLVEFGFYSIDEESYAYLARSMVVEGQFHFETDFAETHSELHRVHFSVPWGDEIFSVFPPGYPMLAVPFYILFGVDGMQIANIFFTVLLVLTFYHFVSEFYPGKDAFIGSIYLLITTQVLNYSVSLWSHIPAAFFILLSIYALFIQRPFFSGVMLGISIVVRYTGAVLLPVALVYLYFKDRRTMYSFLTAFFIGVLPLLFYNYISFGSPFISATSILNAEEGHRIFSITQIPLGILTNILHYTFLPLLEFFPDKGSLLETSPFLIFSILGAYIAWNKHVQRRAEILFLVGSISVFIVFVSGTWSVGGLANNMRLLTDIVPLIVFFSVIPLFHLKTDYSNLGLIAVFVFFFSYFYGGMYFWLKFFNLVVAMLGFIAISAVILLNKSYDNGIWKDILLILLVVSISCSIFSVVSTTKSESLNRREVKRAANNVALTIPDDSVIFIFGGAYPSYTDKDYIFLDYSHAPEDIPKLIEFYKDRPIYAMFKEKRDMDLFAPYQLSYMEGLGIYELKLEH